MAFYYQGEFFLIFVADQITLEQLQQRVSTAVYIRFNQEEMLPSSIQFFKPSLEKDSEGHNLPDKDPIGFGDSLPCLLFKKGSISTLFITGDSNRASNRPNSETPDPQQQSTVSKISNFNKNIQSSTVTSPQERKKDNTKSVPSPTTSTSSLPSPSQTNSNTSNLSNSNSNTLTVPKKQKQDLFVLIQMKLKR